MLSLLVLFFYLMGGFSTESYSESLFKMERKITLVPVGDIESWVLDALDKDLEKKFNCNVAIHKCLELPQEAYSSERNQYFSSSILSEVLSLIKPHKQEKVLAITDIDMYVHGLNFVFGEAELGGHFAIVSLTRCRQSFYSLPDDKTLFMQRAIKEATHELGHTFGLKHCPDPKCVMHFSNSLMDTDRKKTSFCTRCQKLLEKSFKK